MTVGDTPIERVSGLPRLPAAAEPASCIYIRLTTPRSDPTAAAEVLVRQGARVLAAATTVAAVRAWAAGEGEAVRRHVDAVLDQLAVPPAAFAGMALGRPLVMGIVNVTPDSFSDGGEAADTESAVARGLEMLAAGADFVDVGGESTRPGADPVPVDAELNRVVPVVAGLAQAGAVVSIDSRRAAVMQTALDAGARIVNDVTALTGDAESLSLVAARGVPVILMHMQGEPQTMQRDPTYACAPLDIYDWLAERVAACEARGLPRSAISVDPGVGFGKTLDHNLQILARLSVLNGLGCPVTLGVSRKSFIGRLDRDDPAKQRLGGSLAAGLSGLDQGAAILRVHDVAETRQAVAVWSAIRRAAEAD